MKDKFIPFEKWSFVDQHGRDDSHWYIRLQGGKYDGVVYRYLDVKLNDTTKSINFDYEVVDHLGDNPHGDTKFNEALGDILRSILADTMEKQDFVLGPKENNES